MVSESDVNEDDEESRKSDLSDDENVSSSYVASSGKAIEHENQRVMKCMETLLYHLQIMRKLIQSLRLRSALISCGVDTMSSSVNGHDMHAYSTAALDALRHEIDKLSFGVNRIQERNHAKQRRMSEGSVGGDDESNGEFDFRGNLSNDQAEDSISAYLFLRSNIEIAKLRAVFKNIHDQVTSVADIDSEDASVLRTVPRLPVSKSPEEQKADASAMGVKLSD